MRDKIKLNLKILILVAIVMASYGLAKNSRAANLSLPANRVIPWNSNVVGVPGGIPTVTANCTTPACNTLCCNNSSSCSSCTDNGQVTRTTINAAIASAPNSALPYGPTRVTAVRIPAGTFNIASGSIDIGRSNVVLRGAGRGQTILKPAAYTTGGFIQTTQSGGVIKGTGTITSGYTKGSSSVVLNDVSTITAGDQLGLYQNNETWMFADNSQTNLLQQTVNVTNVDSATKTVTFDPPLVFSLSSNLNPSWKRWWGAFDGSSPQAWVGIEDLTIDETNTSTIDYGSTVFLYHTHAAWVKNVEFSHFGSYQAVWLEGTDRSTITGNYFHDARSTREGHGVYLGADYWSGLYASSNSGALVENNIGKRIWVLVAGSNTYGSVIAYNYDYDPYSAYINGTGSTGQMDSYITQHEAHGMMDLWEGNVGTKIENDGYHGSGSHQTIFRNYLPATSPSGNVLNRKPISLCRGSYWHNVIGNVLGDPSWKNVPNQSTEYQMTGNGVWYDHAAIWRLGYPDVDNNAYTAGNPPQGPGMAPNVCCIGCGEGFDDQVQATLIRHMNYDYQTNTTRKCDQETEGCVDNFDPNGTTLPASLYYATKPSWWCNETPWPAIGPDVTGGNTTSTYAYKIPAQIVFEGGACTLSGGDPNPPIAPSGLSVQ